MCIRDRVEDTDQERFVEGAMDVIYKTLRETGLNWDEGPDVGGPVGPYIPVSYTHLEGGAPPISPSTHCWMKLFEWMIARAASLVNPANLLDRIPAEL